MSESILYACGFAIKNYHLHKNGLKLIEQRSESSILTISIISQIIRSFNFDLTIHLLCEC